MEGVRRKISSILTLDGSTLEKLISKLTDLGVNSVDDLVDLQFSDISPEILLPIPARKLIRMCAVAPLPSSPPFSTAVTPSAQPSQSVPLRAVDNTPPSATANWHTTYDVVRTISSLMNSSSLSLQQAARCFLDGSSMYGAQRNEIVRCIADDILKLCSNPSRSSLNCVAEQLVTKCPKLQDEIDAVVVGCGYVSLRNQLENRISYLKRPASAQRKAFGVKRRLADGDENSLKKVVRDGYGCVNFLPSVFPENETDETLATKQQQLKEMYAKQEWNDSEVTALMSATYMMQRQDIVGVSAKSVPTVLAEWPFLCQPKWMVQHLQQLLGFDILQRMEEGMTSKRDSLYDFFSAKSATMKRLSTSLSAVDLGMRPPVAVLPLLMAYFREDETALLVPNEVSIFRLV